MSQTRFIPLFSLRTLVLAVLSLAACAALWMNWGPWRIEREFRDGEPRHALGIFLSPDGKWVAAEYFASENEIEDRRTTVVWSTEIGLRDVMTSRGRAGMFSNDSANFVAGSAYEGDFVLWDLRARKELRIPDLDRRDVEFVYFSPDGRQLICHLNKLKTVQLVDMKSLRTIARIENVVEKQFLEEGSRLCYRHADGSIRVVELSSGEELRRIPKLPDWEFEEACLLKNGIVIQASWSEQEWEDRLLLVTGEDYENAHVISGKLAGVSKNQARILSNTEDSFQVTEFATGKILCHVSRPSFYGHTGFIGDGERIVSGAPIRIYDAASGTELFTTQSRGSDDYSHDNKWALCEEISSTAILQVLDLSRMKLAQEISQHGIGADYSRAFSADGELFVSQHQETHALFLWRLLRPAAWWGVAWLAEFWVALGAVMGLGWSVVRDRRAVRC